MKGKNIFNSQRGKVIPRHNNKPATTHKLTLSGAPPPVPRRPAVTPPGRRGAAAVFAPVFTGWILLIVLITTSRPQDRGAASEYVIGNSTRIKLTESWRAEAIGARRNVYTPLRIDAITPGHALPACYCEHDNYEEMCRKKKVTIFFMNTTQRLHDTRHGNTMAISRYVGGGGGSRKREEIGVRTL